MCQAFLRALSPPKYLSLLLFVTLVYTSRAPLLLMSLPAHFPPPQRVTGPTVQTHCPPAAATCPKGLSTDQYAPMAPWTPPICVDSMSQTCPSSPCITVLSLLPNAKAVLGTFSAAPAGVLWVQPW